MIRAFLDEVKLLSALVLKPALTELSGEFERTNGHKLTISYDSAGAAKNRLQNGDVDESADAKCGARALPACTKQRVAALRRLGAELKEAASQQSAAAPSDPKAREVLARYDRWLLQQAGRAAALANEGEDTEAQTFAATKNMQETQMSFNLQYLQLQNSMQNENRQYGEKLHFQHSLRGP